MRAFLILWATLAASCASSCVTVPPKPTPPVDFTCAAVCSHGAELGCVYATPTKGGASCVQVCENATAAGQMWRLSCLAAATTCDPLACP